MTEISPAPAGSPPPRTAPRVVAVMVARDPGSWFPEVVAGLAAQDYTNLSVLVLDAGDDPVEAAVTEVLPDAVVKRVLGRGGYGEVVNLALRDVKGAPYLLLVHDDVALAPDAVSTLVAESLRSNAGICGPKLVDWNDHRRLRQVGASVDKTGELAPLCDPGELDQEQHDSVRDVFVIPTGAVLIRADLFHAVGGFDEEISFLGDDVDLCWRAQLHGARVMVVPDAVGRHREALGVRRPVDDRRRLFHRHRLRTMAKCYGWLHLLRVLPQAVMVSLGEVLYSLVVGRFSQARDVLAAWWWNLRRAPELYRARRTTQGLRKVRDVELRRQQVRGSARLTAFLRGQIGGEARLADLAARGRDLAGTLGSGPQRSMLVGLLLLALVLVVGGRSLITDGVPAYGELARFPSAGSLVDAWTSGWQETGLGASGAGPIGPGLLGIAGFLLGGATGLLRQILVLGLAPAGAVGAWRLLRPFGSSRAQLAGAAAMLAVPLSFRALAVGNWGTMLAIAVMPWCLARVARLSGVAPFGDAGGGRGRGRGVPQRSLLHQVVALGLLLGVAAAFEPSIPLLVVGAAAAMVVGASFAGSVIRPVRAMLFTAAAAALGLALHLPWLLRAGDAETAWRMLVGVPPTEGAATLAEILRFDAGLDTATASGELAGAAAFGDVLGFAGLIVAAFPLLVARDERLAWTARAWAVALASFGGAWVAARGWLPVDLPRTDLLLAPAAVAVPMAAGLAVAAFDADVEGTSFSWRQLGVLATAVAAVAWAVPLVGAMADGRWQAPASDWPRSLAFIDDDEALAADGSFRVLWIGGDTSLPLAGWDAGGGLRVATSTDGIGDVRGRFVRPDDDGADVLVEVVRSALDGETARLGRLLGPMAVRYVVVLDSATPSFAAGPDQPVPGAVRAALASQLDLERVPTDTAAAVFRNTSFRPRRALFAADALLPVERDLGAGAAVALAPATAALAERESATIQRGRVGPGLLYQSDLAGDEWRLDGEAASGTVETAFGFGRVYPTVASDGGAVELHHERSQSDLFALLGQVAAWLVVARIAVAEAGRQRIWTAPWRWFTGRRRRRRADDQALEVLVTDEVTS